ncbi:carbon-monoxide dehydrogenase medium subunit [Sphingomonas palmae]|uniref:Carbon-monoxide dehydrogenase medium subunit n=1 Tax=Sphingomonas palmae TaxID=1855283 RepID=A0A1H7T413_9SPHN|nr:FAD binding domain-containing protein [Sphingomonas palmae]SEL79229.1 carbon-monoxide dehydrogenase medium subunit [Sphingomonas palmae]
MLDFELRRPTSLEDALAMLDTDDPSVRPWSGGTALMLMMKSGVFEPSVLVDLTGVEEEHASIRRLEDGGTSIGALATLASLQFDPHLASEAPVLGQALPRLANVRVRNVARVGGCLAHGDPHMDLPPILACLRGLVVARKADGERRIAVEQLFAGYYETVLDPGEIITAVELPTQTGWDSVYRKTTVRTHHDWPTVGVAISLRREAGLIVESRVIVSAATEKLTRLEAVENLLAGQPSNAALFTRAGRTAAELVETIDDAQGSASYKRVLVGVEVRRALSQILEEGSGS